MKNTLLTIGITTIIVLIIVGLTSLSDRSENTTSLDVQSQAISDHHGSEIANGEVFNSLVGKQAPGFMLESYEGEKIDLTSLRGKKVVLFFTEGLMCYPACWNQMAAFGKDPFFTSNDIVTLNITVDQKTEWKQAVSKMPELAKTTVLFDSDKAVSNTYGVLSLPSSMHKGQFPGHTYLILDREGIVRFTKDDIQMGVRNDELKAELAKID